MRPASIQPKHIPAVDGLRFFAILAVVLHHLSGGSHKTLFQHLLGVQTGNGIGVTIFLMLSGMLLTGILINTRFSENRYSTFIYRRCIRIFPLYFVYVLGAIVLTWLLTSAPMLHSWVFLLFLQSNFIKTSELTQSVLPLYHLWTIAVQEQFYLVWPLVIWACRSTRQIRMVCWSVVGVSFIARCALFPAAWTLMAISPHSVLARSGELCFGALLALELRTVTHLSILLRRSLAPMSAIALLWMWKGTDTEKTGGSAFGLLLFTLIGAGIIVTLIDPTTILSRISSMRALTICGKRYSFGIYIFHPMLITYCAHLHKGKGLSTLVFAAMLTLISVASYHLFEVHFLAKKANPALILEPAPVALLH